MKTSSATKVERFMVIIDEEYRCFVDVAYGIVVGFEIPQILYDPGGVVITEENWKDKDILKLLSEPIGDVIDDDEPQGKYTLQELQDAVLEEVIKKGILLSPHQDCMDRVKKKVYSQWRKET